MEGRLRDCICLACGVGFHEFQSRIAQGRGKYCSRRCSDLNRPKESAESRFWRMVVKGPNLGDCWGWLGATDPKGYGALHVETVNGRTRVTSAHRFSWELHKGPIPDDLCSLHHCDNPPCSHPEHLFLGDRIDNNADMKAKGRHAFGSKNGHAVLTEEAVFQIRETYNPQRGSIARLAAQFSVSATVIHNVVSRKSWRHL